MSLPCWGGAKQIPPFYMVLKMKWTFRQQKKKNYFYGITLMGTSWSCSCTCCGFLQVFSAPFTSACSSEHFLSFGSLTSTQGDILGPKPWDPTASSKAPYLHCSPWLRVVFQEDSLWNFHPGSFKSCPGHLKAKDLSILKNLKVPTISGWNRVKLRHETWLSLYFPSFVYFPHMQRHGLLYLRPS